MRFINSIYSLSHTHTHTFLMPLNTWTPIRWFIFCQDWALCKFVSFVRYCSNLAGLLLAFLQCLSPFEMGLSAKLNTFFSRNRLKCKVTDRTNHHRVTCTDSWVPRFITYCNWLWDIRSYREINKSSRLHIIYLSYWSSILSSLTHEHTHIKRKGPSTRCHL